MSNLFRFARFSAVKVTLLLFFAFLFAGCGSDVHWFPAYERQPTDPDPFTFATKTNVEPATDVTSDPITVAGLATDTTESPVKISPSTSKYAINGGTATSAEGKVKNGDKITVTHKSGSNIGQSVISTLTIGAVSGTFTTVTRNFGLEYGAPVVFPPYTQVVATVKTTTVAGHTISIKDSINSGSAAFSIGDTTNFTSATRNNVTLGSNSQIYVRNTTTNVVDNKVTTTLVIDDVDFIVPLSTSK